MGIIERIVGTSGEESVFNNIELLCQYTVLYLVAQDYVARTIYTTVVYDLIHIVCTLYHI